MGILDRIKNRKRVKERYQLMTDEGSGFYAWNGRLYHSDLVRAAIRPKAQAVGKAVGKHVRKNANGTAVNPEPYMRFLLEEPNPYMTGQQLQEKLTVHLELNNNAFAVILRDRNGLPSEIYPVNAMGVEAVSTQRGKMYLRFTLTNGGEVTFPYSDIIHLRKDFNDNELFGDSPGEALASLMEIVNTTDQGIVKAVKNSNVIKWLLKFHQTLRSEDIKANTDRFVNDFLKIDENNESTGAAATDAKMDAHQVSPQDYVPNDKQMTNSINRIHSFFNTNEKIIQGKHNENEWISYYELSVEPVVTQLSNELTRKLFTRRERGSGNSIVFESSNLTFASLKTKLDLRDMVDRGALTPNEWREIMNLPPVENGDEPIRRLDTRPSKE